MYPLRGFSLLGVPFTRPPVFLPFAITCDNVRLKIKYQYKDNELVLFIDFIFNFLHFFNMGILGGAIGAGLSAVGSIFGGIAASKAMKKVKNNIESQRSANKDWYERRYNEDATQRADAQAIITRTEQAIKDRNRQAAGTQAIMGGTEESTAATKAANSQALADATSAIALNAERRKDAIESQYQSKDEALQSELNDLERQKAGNVTQAIGGVVSAGKDIAGIL